MRKSVILAAIIGNTLELYDYVLFGYFAGVLATLFFPASDPSLALIQTYGIFASGFVMRPLGALVIGYVGDRIGRKRALELSILLMLIPTLLTGLLPSYAAIGVLAPLLLMLFRMCQGFSVGGELIGSYSYLTEHAPESERAWACTWSLVGLFSGKFLGGLVFLLTTLSMSDASLMNWGWRVPFLLGLVFALAGMYLRRNLEESPVFQKLKQKPRKRAPVAEVWASHKLTILRVIGMTCVHSVGVYSIYIMMPVYAARQFGYSQTVATTSTLFCLAITVVLFPIFGRVTDRYGTGPLLRWGALALMLVAYPGLYLVGSGQVPLLVAGQLLMACVFAAQHAAMPKYYMDAFPEHIRNTAASIAYNVAVLCFGGVTPMISATLAHWTQDSLSPAYLLMLAASVSFLSLLLPARTRVSGGSVTEKGPRKLAPAVP